MMQQTKTLEQECGQIPKDDCEINPNIDLLVRVPNLEEKTEEYYSVPLHIEYNHHSKDLARLRFDDDEYETFREIETTPLAQHAKNFDYAPMLVGVGAALMLACAFYLSRLVYKLDQRDLGRFREELSKPR